MRLVRSAAAASTTAGADDGKFRAMVLANAEHIEANLIGQLDLLDEVVKALSRADALTGAGVGRHLGESINANLHC